MRRLGLYGLVMGLLAGCTVIRPAPPPAVPPVAPVVAAPPAATWILVRKTERTLSLYAGEELVKTYPIVLGKDPVWAKLNEGDHRTPEGEFHIIEKYYHPYWERFMLLDYPTSANQKIYAWSRAHGLIAARGHHVPGIGGAIGIHGTEDESLNRRGINWTEGCVSLFNHDIVELYDAVPLGTRVVIER